MVRDQGWVMAQTRAAVKGPIPTAPPLPLALLAALLLATWGCDDKKSPEAPPALPISAITVEAGAALPPGAPSAEAVEGWATEAISSAERLKLDSDDKKGQPARLVYTAVVEGGEAHVLLMGEVEPPERATGPDDEVPLGMSALERQPVGEGGAEAALKEAARRASASWVYKLDALVGARRASDADLVAMLSRDPALPREAVLGAVEQCRERRLKACAPALRARLATEDAEVLLGLAGALVRLEDRDSSQALVDATTRLSRAGRAQDFVAMIYLLGDLGGAPARQYLTTLAEAHPVPQVQEAAGQALKSMAPEAP